MVLQAEDMKRATEIDSDCIESQFEFRGLAASKSPPEYWKNLGSSKSRSEEQAFQGKNIILEKIHQLKKNTTLAFTDGSCKGNPGPCGAGAAILISNSTEHVELTQPVSNRGSILLGELVAIKLVIDFLIIPNNRKNTESIQIFSDSQSAIGILTLNWKSDNYGKTIHDIKIGILALKSEGIIVSIEWTPGHADIQGNELADQLAKKAAQEAEKIQSIPIFTKQDIQKGAKDSTVLW
ncbi:ribonuclease H-like [Mytilus trossulus]|uniref:ribonuclease H-like n=1 Tax=Mytilus trossulus TaxID=6551 RepID=UPI0030058172